MKNILLLALLIMFASSCTKEKIKRQLYGTWELQSSVQNEPGRVTAKYQPGNGTYIELKPNGTINRYENAALRSSETFKIIKKKVTQCESPQENYWAIEYESEYDEQIEVDGDMLKLSTAPCLMDGGSSTYVRVNK